MSTYRPSGANGYSTSPFGKPALDKELTHERIAADMAAFSKAGGKVEVLGVTPLRRKSDNAATNNGASAKKPAASRTKGD